MVATAPHLGVIAHIFTFFIELVIEFRSAASIFPRGIGVLMGREDRRTPISGAAEH
jgi:hypothetical protein